MDDRLRALNRFGLGARVGEAEEVRSPRRWLHDQVDSWPVEDGELPPLSDLDEIGAVLSELRTAQRNREPGALGDARRRLRDHVTGESKAILTQRVRTDRPFVERLVGFWANHLCVSASANPRVGALAGHYERTAIRPHVLGRLEEMVLASAKHPAMLFYLDNFQSVGPGSPAGRRTAQRGNPRGLNENYARELLELHTLGVDGGYSQPDVEALARILTGWTVEGVGPGARGEAAPAFVFRGVIHEPGTKTVLGRRYGSGPADAGLGRGGLREGEDVIRHLCRSPATAHFVATKLVRHFVSDDPPDAAVNTIADVFETTGGNLREVAHSLVELDEAWTVSDRKFRTPQEWLIAVFRAFGADDVPDRGVGLLRQLRHALWSPPSPKGFEDTQGPWSDPDALMNRAELARSVARLTRDRDPRAILRVVDLERGDPLPGLLADSSIPARDRVALGIAGPAFQWR